MEGKCIGGDGDSPEEDALLDELDRLWNLCSREERDSFESEGKGEGTS